MTRSGIYHNLSPGGSRGSFIYLFVYLVFLRVKAVDHFRKIIHPDENSVSSFIRHIPAARLLQLAA